MMLQTFIQTSSSYAFIFLISAAGVVCPEVTSAQQFRDTHSSSLSEGEQIYRSHCLRCHGETGDGKGPDAVNLVVPPRDFHSPESTAKSETDLRGIIIWGLVFSPMHGWWDQLSPDQIGEVIRYIRYLAPYQPRI